MATNEGFHPTSILEDGKVLDEEEHCTCGVEKTEESFPDRQWTTPDATCLVSPIDTFLAIARTRHHFLSSERG